MSINRSVRSGGIIGIYFRFFNMKVCCVFLLESPHRGDSNEYTQYTIFNIRKENHPKLSQICSNWILFQGTQEEVRRRTAVFIHMLTNKKHVPNTVK